MQGLQNAVLVDFEMLLVVLDETLHFFEFTLVDWDIYDLVISTIFKINEMSKMYRSTPTLACNHWLRDTFLKMNENINPKPSLSLSLSSHADLMYP